MDELLSNPQVSAALIALIVVLLNAFAQWAKSKFSHTSLVNEYWPYIQPLAEAAIVQKAAELQAGTWGTGAAQRILAESLAGFSKTFKTYERSVPNATLLAAVAAELEQTIMAEGTP